MLFSISIFLLSAVAAMVMFYYRHRLASLLPSNSSQWRSGYTRLSTFSAQASAGLTSDNFDLEENNLLVIGGDPRAGLDEEGAREVQDIMQRQGVSFDEARLIRHKRILHENGIDPSGMPLDAKAVTRL